jgi:hypothetical protein
MFTVYLVITLFAAVANLVSAGLDFVGYERVIINMNKAGVPQSWLIPLGVLKTAGALGLLAGIWIPPIGIAAAAGLVLFFSGAIVTHLRARFYDMALTVAFFALSVAALALQLATA